MTESRASVPGRGEALQRDEIVATKVTIPRVRPDSLRRSRLLEALDEAGVRGLTLVCTPAGFGKTTLLADWAQGSELPAAWLSLDQDDNDPARFWRHVVAAVDRAGVPVGERVLSMLDPRSGASSQGVAVALVNEVAGLPEEFALVLDDYHAVESRSIHEGLTFLLDHLSPQLHLVVSSRSDPPLPLARLRAHGQLAELRAADLRFTSEESAAFLREVWGLDLSPEAVASLEARTEGWAAGLQLAALSLRERPDPGAFVDAFSGTQRYVLDYLSEEVLDRQREKVRAFLLRTSILQRLTGRLCDAVTGESDGQGMLQELERAGLFLVPLDEERRWYRFHHLFADILRARLGQAEEARVRELHRRAATWFERHGLIDEAVRHALVSGDADWAARLVEEHLADTLRLGEGVMLERWLSALPQEVVLSRPRLCHAQAMLMWERYRLDEMERLIEHGERALRVQPDSRDLPVPTEGGMVAEVPAAIALLRAQVTGARGDAERLTEFARAALASMAEEEAGPRFWARLLLVVADWLRGRMEEAESGFAEMLAEGRAAPDPHPLMTVCSPLARVQQSRGKLGAALRTYRDGLRFASRGGRLSPFHAGEAHLGIAKVLYARNELDEALRHVTEGITLCRQVVESSLLGHGLVSLAWIRQAMGDAEGAVEAIDVVSDMLPATGVGVTYAGLAERALLMLALGRVSEAQRWAEERGLRETDEISFSRERDYLVLARVLLAGGNHGPALGLLERLAALADSQGRKESLIEIQALRSLALQSAGDHLGALTALAQALSMARPEGYIRVFADEGPPMAALIRSLMTARQRGRIPGVSRTAQEHVTRVALAFGPRMGEKAPGAPRLIEPLTDREVEVLRLVAGGRRNPEIARELVVTLDTVKKHVGHILGKLGAANRTEAVARGREVGLIP